MHTLSLVTETIQYYDQYKLSSLRPDSPGSYVKVSLDTTLNAPPPQNISLRAKLEPIPSFNW